MYPHLSFAIRISIIRHRNSLHDSKTGIEIDMFIYFSPHNGALLHIFMYLEMSNNIVYYVFYRIR